MKANKNVCPKLELLPMYIETSTAGNGAEHEKKASN